tara:strand:- start:3085 stop:3381 length:297 start_codon:yes stop_codon:yes gene_type:complete
MDIIELINSLGIPVAVACVLGYGCYYLIGFINGRLMQKLDEQAKRQEDILVTLINVQKEFTNTIIETNTEMKSIYRTFNENMFELIKIIKNNGLGGKK